MLTQKMITLIEDEARKRKIAAATLCGLAAGNNRIYRNLTGEGSITLEVADRIIAWVEANPIVGSAAA